MKILAASQEQFQKFTKIVYVNSNSKPNSSKLSHSEDSGLLELVPTRACMRYVMVVAARAPGSSKAPLDAEACCTMACMKPWHCTDDCLSQTRGSWQYAADGSGDSSVRLSCCSNTFTTASTSIASAPSACNRRVRGVPGKGNRCKQRTCDHQIASFS